MKNTEEMIVKIRISARYILAAIALALIVWRPAVLESASMTMTSYYPAPYGGYNQLLTTGTTLLGDSASSKVNMVRNGGTACVGSSSSGVTHGVDCTGNAKKGSLGVYGDLKVGFPHSTSVPTQDSTFSGELDVAGVARLGRYKGQVIVGENFSGDAYSTRSYGLRSNVPVSTNKWIYVGPGGNNETYNSPVQLGRSDNQKYGLLVNTEQGSTANGLGVINGNYSGRMTISGGNMLIGSNGGLYLHSGGTAGENFALSFAASTYPTMTVYGNATFNREASFRSNIRLNNATAGTVNATVYGLCYQKVYGLTNTTSCASGYTLIGFVPNDGLGGRDNNANARGMFYVGSVNAVTPGVSNGKADVGYSNPHVVAGGWLTCCAMDIPVVG